MTKGRAALIIGFAALAALIVWLIRAESPVVEPHVPSSAALKNVRSERTFSVDRVTENTHEPTDNTEKINVISVGKTIAIPPPVFTPRPQNEWQGARVDESVEIGCESSATCGFALACVDGICRACQNDGQCLPGERCAMQHCILSENYECSRRADCKVDELCQLSPLSPGIRSNAHTRSYCSDGRGGDTDESDRPAPTPGPRTERADSPAMRTSARVDEMRREKMKNAP